MLVEAMSRACERHGERGCPTCRAAWWARFWAMLEVIGEIALAVLEGIADADWGDD